MTERWKGEAVSNKKRRLRRKLQAIEYLGGKCQDCKEDDTIVLEFDHAEKPRDGDKTIAAYMTGSWERLRKQLEPCELVCANCHARRTWARAMEKIDIRG